MRKHYQKPDHPRKLGSVCWCEGDLEAAESYYSNALSEAQFYRAGPDDDRLIKLAFYREQWDKVVGRFCEGIFGPGSLAGQICIGRSHAAASPNFQVLACAIKGSDEHMADAIASPLSFVEFARRRVERNQLAVLKLLQKSEGGVRSAIAAWQNQALHERLDLMVAAAISFSRYTGIARQYHPTI